MKSIEIMFIESQNWNELIYLCDLVYQMQQTEIYEFIIQKLTNQLITDLLIMDKKRNTHNLQTLASNLEETKQIIEQSKKQLDLIAQKDEEFQMSNLSFYFPRIKSSIDRRSRIARECAIKLNSFNSNDLKQKILSYNHFRKLLSILTFQLKRTKDDLETNPRVHFNLARSDKQSFETLMKSNVLSDAIINPVPEPVDISSRDKMQPLYDWLAESTRNSLAKLNENDLKFLKGTVTTDGRLDLCKQVIGPNGVQPLLDSMQNSKHIDRILLGNNIIGDDGAKLIADFIASGKSTILIWYIAGNNITSIGMSEIVKALLNDKQVNGLWLKRNPLKPDGMIPICDLLLHNQTIQVLDLLNCGLLDSGVSILFEGLKQNKTLKHLYLSANGITPIGLAKMLDYFKQVEKSQLETLFLGCNRIGNEGAELISKCLKYAPKLERLNLSSSRIGSLGMKCLCDVLSGNETIRIVDLGYQRSTMDLGELNNFIQDEGVEYLSQILKYTNLISLNITHNHVTQNGFQILVDSIRENQTMCYLDYGQFGVHFNAVTIECLKSYLKRNKELFLAKNSEKDLESVIIPEHVKEIYSVYRTH